MLDALQKLYVRQLVPELFARLFSTVASGHDE